MGQYWMLVNLDKKEFVLPHKLGSGLKLWEQLANHPGTGAALVILLAAMPETRGGGDFDLDANWHGPERTFPEHNAIPGPMPNGYQEIAHRTIGRWAGNRVAFVGDYAEKTDLPAKFNADLIYSLCGTEGEKQDSVEYYRKYAKETKDRQYTRKANRLAKATAYTDISDDVAAVIEHELKGKYKGDGWREFVFTKEE